MKHKDKNAPSYLIEEHNAKSLRMYGYLIFPCYHPIHLSQKSL